MSSKEFVGYSNEEIANAFVLPQRLTKKQEKDAAHQLAEARKKRQQGMSDSDKLITDLLQFKFQLEDYVDKEEFLTKKTFGYFLGTYIRLCQKKRNEFAEEINIHETLLSQFINNRRDPGENIMVRLELHSNNSIPATYWSRLVQKEHEHILKTNKSLRTIERKFVKNTLPVSF